MAFPSGSSGQLEIKYPLDESLFPPEIVATTFVWNDATEGVVGWQVLPRFGGEGDVLRFATTEPSRREASRGARGASRLRLRGLR